jgi:predicted phage terminase large subunit-like protein
VQNALIDGVETAIRLEAEKAGVIELAFLLRDRRLSGHRIDAVPPKGDKYTRAGPFASRVNGGQVLMVRGAWNRAFLDELAVFPAGAHDDQVDAASGAYEMIDHQREFMIAEAPSVVAGWRG